MNSRKLKRRKCHKNGLEIPKDGDTEIFVLPPNLLQKLGIDLGNVNDTGECPSDVKDMPTGISAANTALNADKITAAFEIPSDSRHNSETSKETSILETAHLMTKSVFLSPTFIPITANITPGDTNFGMQQSSNCDNFSVLCMDSYQEFEEQLTLKSMVNKPTNNVTTNNLQVNDVKMPDNATENETIVNYQSDIHFITSNRNNIIGNIITQDQENTKRVSTEEHPDEAYLSDCSNSNTGPIDNTNNLIHIPETHSCNQQTGHSENNNKINILSEEILSPSQLNELKSLHTSKMTCLIPLTVNTIIPGRKTDDILNTLVESDHKPSQAILNNSGSHSTSGKIMSSDSIIIYDDLGNMIQSADINDVINMTGEMPFHVVHVHSDTQSKDLNEIRDLAAPVQDTAGNELNHTSIIKDTEVENCSSSAAISHIENEEIITNNDRNTEGQTNNNSVACLDIVVTDLEKDFEENEESLEKFANAITSNDTDILVNEIESNEKISSNKPGYHNSHASNYISEFETLSEIGENSECVITSNDTEILVNEIESNESVSSNKPGHDNSLVSRYIETLSEVDENSECVTQNSNADSVKVGDNTFNIESNELVNRDGNTVNFVFTDLQNISKKYMNIANEATANTQPVKDIEIRNKNNRKCYSKTASKHTIPVEILSDKHYIGEPKDEAIKQTLSIFGAQEHLNIGESKVTDSFSDLENHKIEEHKLPNVTENVHEKVKEIAQYLCGHFHSKREKNALRSNSNVKKIYANQMKHNNSLNSKLCIQGVEKPGGIEQSEHCNREPIIIRTYRRNKRSKQTFKSTTVPVNEKETLCNATENLEKELFCTNVSNYCETEEFCLCEDFGRLAYYDCDSLYEHIHFWEHKKISCNPEDIMSIYGDLGENFSYENVNLLLDQDSEDDIQKLTGHNICWNNIERNTILEILHKNMDSSSNLAGMSELNAENIERQFDVPNVESNTAHTCDTPNRTRIEIDISDNKCEGEFSAAKGKDCPKTDELYNDDKIILYVESSKVIHQNISGELGIETKPENNILNSRDDIDNPMETITNKHFSELSGQNISEETLAVIKRKKESSNAKEVAKQVNEQETEVSNQTEYEENPVEIKLKKGKKRRNSTNKQDDDEKPFKKTVKCGVCKQLLAEPEWEHHVDKNHCFIAWKTGESFDFENQELFKKLEELLKDSCLKCNLCNIEIKKVRKYLLHVQKCLKANDVPIPVQSESGNEDDVTLSELILERKPVKCGVCEQVVEADLWVDHIAKEHNYLAWKDGEPAMDLEDEETLRKYLTGFAKQIGGLICSKCGLTRRYGKSYLQHVENCIGIEYHKNNSDYIEATSDQVPSTSKVKLLKCGVCTEYIEVSNWIGHIAKVHDYLAWEDGEPPLDLTDDEIIRQHLYHISKQYGGLACSKCGLNRKYVKSYLQHIKNCTQDDSRRSETFGSSSVSVNNVTRDVSAIDSAESDSKLIKCAVCQEEVKSGEWMLHVQNAHNYLAWKEGETLDLDNAEEVHDHLSRISKEIGGLTCLKCGLIRKYVKNYLQHIKTCESENDEFKLQSTDTEMFTCGVCLEHVTCKDWKVHRMKKHYNVAWVVGERPIEIKNPYAVERFLKEYRDKYKKLVCNICGITRVSCIGFYAHVLTCGKSDEEAEIYKNECNICNKKYLCIYESQHMAWHQQQHYNKERKLKEAEQKVKVDAEVEVDITSGRRKAAEKAITVIQKYKSEDGQHICQTCGLNADSRDELKRHKCEKSSGYFSDSDVSMKLESDDSDDDLETDVDSNISDEEAAQCTKKRQKDYIPLSARIPRMPFTVRNPNEYLLNSVNSYYNFHFSDEILFPDWRTCEYQVMLDDQLSKYLPLLEQSCKVRVCDNSWITYDRFETKKQSGTTSIFVGASIQSLSWAPPRTDEADDASYLAVVCHSGNDSPRYEVDDTPQHESLIQIWDFGNFKDVPKFVFGLIHDYGTVWAITWCPSGARDLPPAAVQTSNHARLGLLALASSNGSAYIFSVPYPSAITESEKLFYKLKPVAELRLSTGTQRKNYQATAVSWSPQNGHTFVVVGYGDGTTAYYDLSTDSPLLRTKENNVTILYPYHDERSHNTCVTDVGVFPSMDRSAAAGAVCSAAPTGASAVARPAARPVRVQSHFAASVAMFQPHWPSVLLAGDDTIGAAPNELQWWGSGRRFGPVRACCSCVRCARVALCTPPLLRVTRPHPAHSELTKRTIGTIQMMPIGKKRKQLADDNLATKLEPLTYEEAVKKYGIELKLDKTIQIPSNKVREQYPERFPLADVPSMAFCPAPMYHSKLALATHAGIVFVITV